MAGDTVSEVQCCVGSGRTPAFLRTDDSSVLNDAFEACTAAPSAKGTFKREICFTDLRIETADVLDRFLQLVMKGGFLKWEGTFRGCEALCRTVAFMRKYDCSAGSLSFLTLYVKDKYRKGLFAPFFLFMFAAAMDDVELSIQAFRFSHPSSEYTRYGRIREAHYSPNKGIPGVKDDKAASALLRLVPDDGRESIWPYQLWQYIPADYLWAATTAWTKAWAMTTATAAVNAANSAMAGRTAEEARKTKRPLNSGEKPAQPSYQRVPYTGDRIALGLEYEIAIRAVKKVST